MVCGTRLRETRLDGTLLRIAFFLWTLDRRRTVRGGLYRTYLGRPIEAAFGRTSLRRPRVTIVPITTILTFRPFNAFRPVNAFWPIRPFRTFNPLRPVLAIGPLEPVLTVVALPVVAIAEPMSLLALPLSVVVRTLLPILLMPVWLLPVWLLPVWRLPLMLRPVVRVPVVLWTVLIGPVIAALRFTSALVRTLLWKSRNSRLLGLTDVVAGVVVARLVVFEAAGLTVHPVVRKRSRQALLLAIGHDDANIMFGVLEIILRQHRIA